MSDGTRKVNRTAYVDCRFGDNHTAKLQVPHRPFATIAAAQKAISCHKKCPPSVTRPWLIVLRTGNYYACNNAAPITVEMIDFVNIQGDNAETVLIGPVNTNGMTAVGTSSVTSVTIVARNQPAVDSTTGGTLVLKDVGIEFSYSTPPAQCSSSSGTIAPIVLRADGIVEVITGRMLAQFDNSSGAAMSSLPSNRRFALVNAIRGAITLSETQSILRVNSLLTPDQNVDVSAYVSASATAVVVAVNSVAQIELPISESSLTVPVVTPSFYASFSSGRIVASGNSNGFKLFTLVLPTTTTTTVQTTQKKTKKQSDCACSTVPDLSSTTGALSCWSSNLWREFAQQRTQRSARHRRRQRQQQQQTVGATAAAAAATASFIHSFCVASRSDVSTLISAATESVFVTSPALVDSVDVTTVSVVSTSTLDVLQPQVNSGEPLVRLHTVTYTGDVVNTPSVADDLVTRQNSETVGVVSDEQASGQTRDRIQWSDLRTPNPPVTTGVALVPLMPDVAGISAIGDPIPPVPAAGFITMTPRQEKLTGAQQQRKQQQQEPFISRGLLQGNSVILPNPTDNLQRQLSFDTTGNVCTALVAAPGNPLLLSADGTQVPIVIVPPASTADVQSLLSSDTPTGEISTPTGTAVWNVRINTLGIRSLRQFYCSDPTVLYTVRVPVGFTVQFSGYGGGSGGWSGQQFQPPDGLLTIQGGAGGPSGAYISDYITNASGNDMTLQIHVGAGGAGGANLPPSPGGDTTVTIPEMNSTVYTAQGGQSGNSAPATWKGGDAFIVVNGVETSRATGGQNGLDINTTLPIPIDGSPGSAGSLVSTGEPDKRIWGGSGGGAFGYSQNPYNPPRPGIFYNVGKGGNGAQPPNLASEGIICGQGSAFGSGGGGTCIAGFGPFWAGNAATGLEPGGAGFTQSASTPPKEISNGGGGGGANFVPNTVPPPGGRGGDGYVFVNVFEI